MKAQCPYSGGVRFKTGVKISGAPTGRRRKLIFCGVAQPHRKKPIKTADNLSYTHSGTGI
jgi:hypothetical protein